MSGQCGKKNDHNYRKTKEKQKNNNDNDHKKDFILLINHQSIAPVTLGAMLHPSVYVVL